MKETGVPESGKFGPAVGSGLIRLAIRRPTAVLVGMILACLFGSLALLQLPIQLTPDIEKPTLTVNTIWPGSAPTEVEAEILEPQEEVLRSLSGLEEMTSQAEQESGNITLELGVGTSVEESLVRVTNLLSQVSNLPRNARAPVVNAARSTGPPLAVITLTSKANRDVSAFRTWVTERIQPQLERIEGVGLAFLIGGRDQTYEVSFDPTALSSRGLTIQGVGSLLQAELRDISAGDVQSGKHRVLVRTPLIPDQPSDLEGLVLRADDEGKPVTLGDIASVRYGLRKPQAIVFSDDRPSMVFLLFREAGSNVLTVTKAIRATVDELNERLLSPRNMELEVVSDQVAYIEGALNLVQQNLFLGGGLAVLVLMMFLGSFRASIVISVAIPVCTLGTALGMSLLGRTVNVVSLAGMAFAVGMVVDNAIVVLENIDTWRKRTSSIEVAASQGAGEVWGAVLASTLTTVVVFIPIAVWRDEVGEILRDIAVAISLAVTLSLIVSVLVIPSLANRFLRDEQSDLRPQKWVRWAAGFRDRLGAWVGRLAIRPVAASMVVFGSVLMSVLVSVTLLPPMEYLPNGNRPFVFGVLIPPPGYAVEEMGRVGKIVQSKLVPHLGVEKDGVPPLTRMFFSARLTGAFMGAGSEDPTRTKEIARYFRKIFSEIPDVFGIASQASLFGRSLGGSRQISIELSGSDLGQLSDVGRYVMGAVKDALPDAQARPDPPLDGGATELRIRPRRREAAKVGMTGADIGLAVDALVDGAIIGELGRPGEPKLDVVLSARLRGREGGVETARELAQAPVGAKDGQVILLDSVASVEETVGPTRIRRIERRRAVTIQVSPPDEIPLEEALAIIRDGIVAEGRQEGKIPPSVEVRLSGAAGDLEVAQARFGRVLLLAVVISFLLMAALFEDFIAPVIVMVSVPLAAAGGIAGLRLVDWLLGPQPLDMLTAVGFVILIGVVVNNAILVVDGALNRLREGAGLEVAIGASVGGRLRPIFMSALTSLAGLSPLVFFPGSGSELYRGVGSVVLGGLTLSTILTLFVVPSLFALVWRGRLGRSA